MSAAFRRPRTPFASRSRADALTRAEVRANWIKLLGAAQAYGAVVAAGGTLGRDAAGELAWRIAKHAPAPFPLTHASALNAAAGFRLLAQGFRDAGLPELKAALAAAMAAAAVCCRRLLELDEAAQAESFARQTRARLGEREED